MSWVRGVFRRHQFLAGLVVAAVVVVPGYVRQEQTIGEAHDAAATAQRAADRAEEVAIEAQDTADALSRLISALEQERAERRHELCLRDVDDRDNDRAMWLFLFQQFAGAPNVPVVAEALDRLLPPLECDDQNVPVPIEG